MKRFGIWAWLAIWWVTGLEAQRISGNYFGRGESRTGLQYNSYLAELNLLKKGTSITGTLGYYFGQHHYALPITGKYWERTRTIELNPFKLISFFAQDSLAPDCAMDGSLTMYIWGTDTVLYGQLNPIAGHRYGCPLITISLTKALPELNAPPLTPLPAHEKKEAPDSQATMPSPPIPALWQRSFDTSHLIEVDTDTVLLHLYDNGKIDFDTVSVYFNRQPVITKQQLSLKPIELQLVLQPGVNEIALFAENLGEIPPNTALCIIYAGGERYDINLLSTLMRNGTVRIKSKKRKAGLGLKY